MVIYLMLEEYLCLILLSIHQTGGEAVPCDAWGLGFLSHHQAPSLFLFLQVSHWWYGTLHIVRLPTGARVYEPPLGQTGISAGDKVCILQYCDFFMYGSISDHVTTDPLVNPRS
jgi:hypothetical protein